RRAAQPHHRRSCGRERTGPALVSADERQLRFVSAARRSNATPGARKDPRQKTGAQRAGACRSCALDRRAARGGCPMMPQIAQEAPDRTIGRARIAEIETRIRPNIRRTPCIEIDAAELGLDSFRLILKLEQLQHAGSFKARGAFANLLTRKVPQAGVVA